MPHVQFFRDYHEFTGGHLKVWHYFNHVRALPDFSASIRFSRDSTWENGNPWAPLRAEIEGQNFQPTPDLAFVDGLEDWPLFDAQFAGKNLPVINFIQHVRHADPENARYQFLARPAIRICVSRDVAQAIEATGKVNGPIFTIPNALDADQMPAPLPLEQRTCDVVIAGLKNPELAFQLREKVRHFAPRLRVLSAPLPRADYLESVRRARVALFLPTPTEGFYLPALESMALGTIVVCPDVVGNRSFCVPGVNCFRPRFHSGSLTGATRSALMFAAQEPNFMRQNALQTAAEHSPAAERAAFAAILGRAAQLWSEMMGGLPN